MPEPFPAICLVAVPGRRRQALDIAREIERRGFSGIYMPSRFGNMAQCTGLAFATERIAFGTAIASFALLKRNRLPVDTANFETESARESRPVGSRSAGSSRTDWIALAFAIT